MLRCNLFILATIYMLLLCIFIQSVQAQQPTTSPTNAPTANSPDLELNQYNYYLYLLSGSVWIVWVLILAAIAHSNFKKRRWLQFCINMCFVLAFLLRDCFYWGLFYQHEYNRDQNKHFTPIQNDLRHNRLYITLFVSVFQLLGVSILLFSWINFLKLSNHSKKKADIAQPKPDQSASVDIAFRHGMDLSNQTVAVVEYKSKLLKNTYQILFVSLVLLNLAFWIYISVRMTAYSTNAIDKDQFFKDDLLLVSIVTLLESVLMVILSALLANAFFSDIVTNPITSDSEYISYFQPYTDEINKSDNNQIKKLYYTMKFVYVLTFRRNRIAPEILKPERRVLSSVFFVAISVNFVFIIRFIAAVYVYHYVTASGYTHEYNQVLVVNDFGYNLCYPWLLMEFPECVTSCLINIYISPREGVYWTYVYPFLLKMWRRICFCQCCQENLTEKATTEERNEYSSALNDLLINNDNGSNEYFIERMTGGSLSSADEANGRKSEIYLSSFSAKPGQSSSTYMNPINPINPT